MRFLFIKKGNAWPKLPEYKSQHYCQTKNDYYYFFHLFNYTLKRYNIAVAKQKKKPPILLLVILFILTIFAYQLFISDKYHPVTKVGNINISFLTKGQAIRKVQSSFEQRMRQKLQFGSYTIDLATSSAKIDYSILDLPSNHTKQLQTLLFTSIISPKITLSLEKQLEAIAQSVDREPQNAQLLFNETTNSEGSPSAHIQIKEEVDGLSLDKKAVEKQITDYLLISKYKSNLPIKAVTPKVTTQQVLRAKQALENSQKEPVKLNFEGRSWILDTKQLLTLLNLTKGEALLLDKDKTFAFLGAIAQEIDQEVQEGLFEFNPQTKRVIAFKPSQEGRKLNLDKAYGLITDALTNQTSKNITLPVSKNLPKIQTSDVNSLGIKELLGRGISNFAGSIPNRIYNIQLAASRINGVLITPGEVFSFNEKVGDISAASGYKPAYVIKSGRTVLDDGGGVCQDSTTLFRAVLNAGLPVVQRVAHAYRVGYYEQSFPPGLDATVWAPSVDFKFKNDTPSHILIQAYTSGTTLYVDLYGSSDGRVVALSKPVVSSQTPPPPELKTDDPSLTKGTVKQVDFAAWGATVSFNRTVTRGSETLITETFKSNYRAWQAVYLVGTKGN